MAATTDFASAANLVDWDYCTDATAKTNKSILKEVERFASLDGFKDIIGSLVTRKLERLIQQTLQHGILIGRKAQNVDDEETLNHYRQSLVRMRTLRDDAKARHKCYEDRVRNNMKEFEGIRKALNSLNWADDVAPVDKKLAENINNSNADESRESDSEPEGSTHTAIIKSSESFKTAFEEVNNLNMPSSDAAGSFNVINEDAPIADELEHPSGQIATDMDERPPHMEWPATEQDSLDEEPSKVTLTDAPGRAPETDENVNRVLSGSLFSQPPSSDRDNPYTNFGRTFTLAAPNPRAGPGGSVPAAAATVIGFNPAIDFKHSKAGMKKLLRLLRDNPGHVEALNEARKRFLGAMQTPKAKRSKAQELLMENWSGVPPQPQMQIQPAAPLHEMYVDASNHGVGLIFQTVGWLGWTFKHSSSSLEKGVDDKVIMSWAELIAVELAVRTYITLGFNSCNLILRSDNQGVVKALKDRVWLDKFGLAVILARVLKLCKKNMITITCCWVSSDENLADAISRGLYPREESMPTLPAPLLPAALSNLLEPVT